MIILYKDPPRPNEFSSSLFYVDNDTKQLYYLKQDPNDRDYMSISSNGWRCRSGWIFSEEHQLILERVGL